jgi:tetratricopeptide (TPR) repeat protein
MAEPTSELVGRVLVEKRFELYARTGAQLLELEEALGGDLRRVRLLLGDLRRTLRTGLALLTGEVHRELVGIEELAEALEGEPRDPARCLAELGDRLQLLHVHLARMLRRPHLEELEDVVGMPSRLRHRLEAERRDQDALARGRALEEQCLRHEAEARDLVAGQQYARAARALRRGVQLDPERAVLHNDLGVVLSMMGQASEAVDSYRRAVALNERRPERRTDEWATTYYNLGIALRKWAAESLQRGERDLARERLAEARTALGEFVRLVPQGPKPDEARRALDQITGQILSIEAPAEAT